MSGKFFSVFLNELLGSLLFFFIWIVMRHHYNSSSGAAQDPNQRKNYSLDAILKSVLLSFAYYGCQSLGSPFFNGLNNPNFALQQYFWSRHYYSYHEVTPPMPEFPDTIYEFNTYGRYAWTYASAPWVAAVGAGLLAGAHLKGLQGAEERSSTWSQDDWE